MTIISSLVKKEYIRQALLSCVRLVDQGRPFSQVASAHPDLFDVLTIHALKAGDQSGFLAVACRERARQLNEISQVHSKVRSVLAVPLVTAIFFVIVSLFLLLYMLPQFTRIFDMLKTPLPMSTRFLIACGEWITVGHIAGIMLFTGLIIGLFYALKRTVPGKIFCDYFLLNGPLIGRLYGDFARSQYFHSIALLLHSGQKLSYALLYVGESFNNGVLRKQFLAVQHEVQKGIPFAVALHKSPLLAIPEIENCVIIAHETAELGVILEQLSAVFRARALKNLDRVTILIQPFFLIILGASIGFLLIAMYLPLLQIPQNF